MRFIMTIWHHYDVMYDVWYWKQTPSLTQWTWPANSRVAFTTRNHHHHTCIWPLLCGLGAVGNYPWPLTPHLAALVLLLRSTCSKGESTEWTFSTETKENGREFKGRKYEIWGKFVEKFTKNWSSTLKSLKNTLLPVCLKLKLNPASFTLPLSTL